MVRGNLMGSYFKGSMASHMTWNHVSIPLGKMPDDLKDTLLTVYFREGVGALKELAEKYATTENRIGKPIDADFFPAIAHYNEDPYMMITSASVEIANQCIQNVFSNIENKLLDVLCFLEKGFGLLDDLDIDVCSKSEEEKEEIVKQLYVIVFNDNSVNIGNENRIKDSNIVSGIKE